MKVTLACFFFIATGSAQAAISFAYIIKEKVHWQTGTQRPSSIFEWNVSAGVSGDSQVTGGSVSYPGGSADLSGSNGAYGFEPGDYFSLEELNAVFPNGDVTLSVTENGETQAYGPFSLTGDVYPEVPFVTNSEALQAADFTQDFTVTWDAFDDAVELDEVLFIIEDNLGDGNPVFQFMPGSTTSFLIPGGTLSNDGDYSIQVSFIKKTAVPPPSVNLKVGYISQTRVSTISPSEDPYGNWERGFSFHGQDSSENGDPDYDGLINLLEMVLGTNPLQSEDNHALNAIVVTDAGSDYPGVEIIRSPVFAGIDTQLEMSTDPSFSSSLPQLEVGTPQVLGDGREKRVYRSQTPIAANQGVFIRLFVDSGSGD